MPGRTHEDTRAERVGKKHRKDKKDKDDHEEGEMNAPEEEDIQDTESN